MVYSLLGCKELDTTEATLLTRRYIRGDSFGKSAHVIMEAEISSSLPSASQSMKT